MPFYRNPMLLTRTLFFRMEEHPMTVTLAQLAEHLGIDQTSLQEFGLSDNRLYGGSVRIPYVSALGQCQRPRPGSLGPLSDLVDRL